MDAVNSHARKVIAVLQVLKPLSDHSTINTAIAFLTVAIRPGITVGDVQKTLGLQPSSTARSVSLLYRSARGIPGLDLIESKPSPRDLRIKHLHLTPKGHRIWNQIATILGG